MSENFILRWRILFIPLIDKILPAISVNNRCHSHQWLQPSKGDLVSPEGTQDVKTQILAPDSWAAYQRNDFSEPRLLHLPIHRKVINSLTWDIQFSLINSNLFFLLPALCCKIPIYPTSPLTSWEPFSQGYLRCCLRGLKSLVCPPNKT